MSQAGILNIAGGGGGGSPIETITGNTGGPVSPVANNINLVTANTTVQFAGATPTLTQDFGITNLLLGENGAFISSGHQNVGIGLGSLSRITSGSQNCACGISSAPNVSTGVQNSIYGSDTATNLQSGSGNVVMGQNSFNNCISGSGNIIIGTQTGNQYAGFESYNILFFNIGIAGESNTIRLGHQLTAGTGQNRAFIAGIYNTTPSGSTIQNVVIDNNGQLGAGVGNFNQYTATATSYQVLVTDDIIGVTSTAAPRTITMPNSGLIVGQEWTIKDESGGAFANNITVSGNGANIDGSANFIIDSNYGAITLYWNGTKFNTV